MGRLENQCPVISISSPERSGYDLMPVIPISTDFLKKALAECKLILSQYEYSYGYGKESIYDIDAQLTIEGKADSEIICITYWSLMQIEYVARLEYIFHMPHISDLLNLVREIAGVGRKAW